MSTPEGFFFFFKLMIISLEDFGLKLTLFPNGITGPSNVTPQLISVFVLLSVFLSCTLRKKQKHSSAQSHHSSGGCRETIAVAVPSSLVEHLFLRTNGFQAMRSIRVVRPL